MRNFLVDTKYEEFFSSNSARKLVWVGVQKLGHKMTSDTLPKVHFKESLIHFLLKQDLCRFAVAGQIGWLAHSCLVDLHPTFGLRLSTNKYKRHASLQGNLHTLVVQPIAQCAMHTHSCRPTTNCTICILRKHHKTDLTSQFSRLFLVGVRVSQAPRPTWEVGEPD